MPKTVKRKQASKKQLMARRKKIRKATKQPAEQEPQEEPQELIVFDADSYPIWVSPCACAPHSDLYCLGHQFRTAKYEGEDVRVNIGLILSSKLLIHGVGIFYQTPNPGTYISSIKFEVLKFNEDTGMLTPSQKYDSGDIQLSSISPKEYRFLIGGPGGTPVRGRVSLHIGLHFEKAHIGIVLNGIRVMVKDL